MSLDDGPAAEKLNLAAPAAIRYRSEIFTGRNHEDALKKLNDKYLNADEDDMEGGFVTTTGRFVDRAEGERIAKTAKQVKEYPDYPDFAHNLSGELYTDDLKSEEK